MENFIVRQIRKKKHFIRWYVKCISLKLSWICYRVAIFVVSTLFLQLLISWAFSIYNSQYAFVYKVHRWPEIHCFLENLTSDVTSGFYASRRIIAICTVQNFCSFTVPAREKFRAKRYPTYKWYLYYFFSNRCRGRKVVMGFYS